MSRTLRTGYKELRWTTLFIVTLVLLPAAGTPPPNESLPRPPVPPGPDDARLAVLAIRDCESLVLAVGGEERCVRLAGVYVPRAGGADGEAERFLTRLLTGESLWLEPENGSEAYAYRVPDGLLVNLELLRQGYARVVAAGELKHRPVLAAYERLARQQRKGIWAPANDGQPVTASQPTAEAGSAEPRDGDDELVYVTPHGKKYHRQNCPHVRKGATALTLREARARGYTPCSRCKPPE